MWNPSARAPRRGPPRPSRTPPAGVESPRSPMTSERCRRPSPEPQAPMVATLLQCRLSLRWGAHPPMRRRPVPRRVRPVAVISARPGHRPSGLTRSGPGCGDNCRRRHRNRQWSPPVPSRTARRSRSTRAPSCSARRGVIRHSPGPRFLAGAFDLDTQVKRHAAQGGRHLHRPRLRALRVADPPRRPCPRSPDARTPSTPSLHGTTSSDPTPPAIRGWRWLAVLWRAFLRSALLGATGTP